MLKIKDNVDLKELEKYGFIEQQVGMDNAYVKYRTIGLYEESIIIWLDRRIQVKAIEILDTLYDLIKDDLVEKV
jgi:hypothetical protein